jgi:hypothetical protein
MTALAGPPRDAQDLVKEGKQRALELFLMALDVAKIVMAAGQDQHKVAACRFVLDAVSKGPFAHATETANETIENDRLAAQAAETIADLLGLAEAPADDS